jgi:hypothetical protein
LSDTAGDVHQDEALGVGGVEPFDLRIRRIDQAKEGEVIMFNACAKHSAASLLGIVRRGLAFDGTDHFLRKRMSGLADDDEQELDPIAVSFVELPQVNHLPTEDVSGETAEDEYDGLTAAEVAESNGSPVVQARQGDVRGERTLRQIDPHDHPEFPDVARQSAGLVPLRKADIDSRSYQRAEAQEKSRHGTECPPRPAPEPPRGGQRQSENAEKNERDV